MWINIVKIFADIIIVVIPILLSLDEKYLKEYAYVIKLLQISHKYSGYLIILLLISLLIKYILENQIKNYKKKNEKLEEAVKVYRSFVSSPIDDLLKNISYNLKMNENDRLSVFLYSNSLKKFFSVGRYSQSIKLNEVGRYIIDNEKEYVFKVLNDEKEEHYKSAPEIINKWYSTDKRNMQSKSMYGVPIFNKDKSIKIGVLICQSLKKNAYRSKQVREKIQNETKKVEELLIKMKIDPNYIKSSSTPLKGF